MAETSPYAVTKSLAALANMYRFFQTNMSDAEFSGQINCLGTQVELWNKINQKLKKKSSQNLRVNKVYLNDSFIVTKIVFSDY